MPTTSPIGRIAAVIALIVAAGVVVFLLLGGGDDYEVTAEFENASQLVGGEEVVIAGDGKGKVTDIELGDDGEALVTFSVDDEFAPLRRGTTATIRAFSLSGIANRQVQLTLPPDGRAGEEIPDGGTLAQRETVSEVDLDELFNTLDERTIRNLKKVIEGFEVSYAGVGEEANKGFRLLNPFLSTSRRLFGELTRDERSLERLVVDTDRLMGALAERRDDVSALIGNLNLMMGALGRQKESLAEAVSALPGFMRRANTTFVNLRSTLDDVDPLVDASKPVALKLKPFFAELRQASADLVPTVRDLDEVVKRKGSDNDLVELTRLQPPLARKAIGSGSPTCGDDPTVDFAQAADDDFSQGAFGESVCSLQNALPQLSFFRPYTPELLGWFDDFGHSGTQSDANGGQGRIANTVNTFSAEVPGFPILADAFRDSVEEQFAQLNLNNTRRCPGAHERDPGDGSTPFTDGGQLDCDETQVPVGP